MGGGFMFAGNSAAARPPYSVTANIQPRHQNIAEGFLGPVPSRFEVEKAILQLQRFMSNLPASDNGLRGLLQSPGFNKFSDAFTMMQDEQSLKNLVVSISCDESVWEAIMVNEAVQDLRASFYTEEKLLRRSPEEPDLSVLIMRWIIGFTKSKVLQLLEKFVSLVKDIFEPGNSNKKPTSELTHLLDEKVRSSFLLSVVILLIVVITRGQG